MSRIYTWLFILSFLHSSVLAQKTITAGALGKDSGLSLEIRSVFDPPPPSGYAPLRIVATNDSDGDRLWDFSLTSQLNLYRSENLHRSSLQIRTTAHGTQSATHLAPLATQYGSSTPWADNHQLSITLNVSGAGFWSFTDHSQRSLEFPAVAISKSLAQANHARLMDEVEQRAKSSSTSRGGSSRLFGSEFNPADLPEDWLGLSGFDVVMMTGAEWHLLKAGQRLAIIQWARLGGQIDLYGSTTLTAASADLPVDSAGRLSLGDVHFRTWDGTNLPPEATVGRLWRQATRVKRLTSSYTGQTGSSPHAKPDWAILNALGLRQFASWQVVAFLVIFGLLVGPVNLFLLAPSGKRHKLFITTPLLSIAASLFMVVIILFQDGIGGEGARLVVVNLIPDEASAYVSQEQASRTGVLLGAGFAMKQPALIEPLALPATPWVKLTNSYSSQSVALAQEGTMRSGNYFQSRAEQGQLLHAVIPTRARLEIKMEKQPETIPTVTSALGFTLDELFYVDNEGGVWHHPQPLLTGQQTLLQKSNTVSLRKAWALFTSHSAGQQKQTLLSVANGSLPRNTFFGRAKAAPSLTLETLPAIRWQEDRVVLFGHVKLP